MAHETDVQWMGEMQFNALINGHTIVMDGPKNLVAITMALFQNFKSSVKETCFAFT